MRQGSAGGGVGAGSVGAGVGAGSAGSSVFGSCSFREGAVP